MLGQGSFGKVLLSPRISLALVVLGATDFPSIAQKLGVPRTNDSRLDRRQTLRNESAAQGILEEYAL